MLGLGIEKASIGAADTIGAQRLLEVIGLKQHGKAGDGAFADRGGSQRGQRRPEMFLHLGRDLDVLA